jgi:hypothetical protein
VIDSRRVAQLKEGIPVDKTVSEKLELIVRWFSDR